MIAAGYLTEDDANRWRARPVVVRQRPDFFRTTSPYFAEHVRRDIARRYGEKKLLEGGLDIETAVVPWIDAAAQENVDFSLRKLDKRQGWRGPVARLAGAAADEFRARVAARYGADPPAEGRLYLGLVESAAAGRRGARARRQGDLHAAVRRHDLGGPVQHPRRDQRQAAGIDGRRAARGRRHLGEERAPDEAAALRGLDLRRQERSAVAAGLRRERARQDAEPRSPTKPVELLLEQTPRVQGTIFSYDHDTGYVVAMVGGEDYDRSEFNRVSQACRQPGSVYKPMYYSLALDQRLRLHVAAQRRAARRGRSDHRRGLDADQPQQHRRVPGDAGVRADLVEERARRCSCSSWWAARRSRTGRGGWASRRRSSPTRRWRWARRARASTS